MTSSQASESSTTTNPELLILAQYIDQARIRSNSIPAAEAQPGIYGDLADALIKCLVILAGSERAGSVAYQAILDGAPVKEALEYARENS